MSGSRDGAVLRPRDCDCDCDCDFRRSAFRHGEHTQIRSGLLANLAALEAVRSPDSSIVVRAPCEPGCRISRLRKVGENILVSKGLVLIGWLVQASRWNKTASARKKQNRKRNKKFFIAIPSQVNFAVRWLRLDPCWMPLPTRSLQYFYLPPALPPMRKIN